MLDYCVRGGIWAKEETTAGTISNLTTQNRLFLKGRDWDTFIRQGQLLTNNLSVAIELDSMLISISESKVVSYHTPYSDYAYIFSLIHNYTFLYINWIYNTCMKIM